MLDTEHARWKTALDRVKRIERGSPWLPHRRTKRNFSYIGRSAWATTPGFLALPSEHQNDQGDRGRIRERVSAEAILIGKFDVDHEVRLRSFYPHEEITLRYQTGGERNGVTRTVKAHKAVHDFAPELMPRVFDSGTILDGSGAYLVEEMVTGEPASRVEMQELIKPLVGRLHEVHNGVGISYKPLSKVVSRHFRERWIDFVRNYGVEPYIDRTVQELTYRNDQLAISVSHGDLVRSNILVSENDYILVDWEFVGSNLLHSTCQKCFLQSLMKIWRWTACWKF